ncbi:MAG: glycoside hydrolase family 25 protein [Bacteroidaceae bacterium]|nr:glycoside hydrolase family 25 protein [Bacteroidaceae bacterium]MBR4515894.1 glycoside hydrolase family 25 protein [Bacteroidaceae bacterium]
MTTKTSSHNPSSSKRRGFTSSPVRGKGKVCKKSSRGKRRGVFFFRRFPSWVMWLGGLLIAAAYICFFYYTFVSPFSFRWRAIYGTPTYPDGYEVRGIDISHYQDRINWEKLRNATIGDAPVSFVFIKATEGEKMLDDNFNENFAQARRNDIIRGAYHFFIPGISPRRQADFFLHQAQLEPGDLPPILDVEKNGNLTPEQLRRDVLTWLNMAEKKYGAKPILYTGYKFKMQYLNTPEFDVYPYWIAHYYVDKLEYTGKWTFWQHTDCGKVSGIRGFVDCNIFNGTMQELQELTLPEP